MAFFMTSIESTCAEVRRLTYATWRTTSTPLTVNEEAFDGLLLRRSRILLMVLEVILTWSVYAVFTNSRTDVIGTRQVTASNERVKWPRLIEESVTTRGSQRNETSLFVRRLKSVVGRTKSQLYKRCRQTLVLRRVLSRDFAHVTEPSRIRILNFDRTGGRFRCGALSFGVAATEMIIRIDESSSIRPWAAMAISSWYYTGLLFTVAFHSGNWSFHSSAASRIGSWCINSFTEFHPASVRKQNATVRRCLRRQRFASGHTLHGIDAVAAAGAVATRRHLANKYLNARFISWTAQSTFAARTWRDNVTQPKLHQPVSANTGFFDSVFCLDLLNRSTDRFVVAGLAISRFAYRPTGGATAGSNKALSPAFAAQQLQLGSQRLSTSRPRRRNWHGVQSGACRTCVCLFENTLLIGRSYRALLFSTCLVPLYPSKFARRSPSLHPPSSDSVRRGLSRPWHAPAVKRRGRSQPSSASLAADCRLTLPHKKSKRWLRNWCSKTVSYDLAAFWFLYWPTSCCFLNCLAYEFASKDSKRRSGNKVTSTCRAVLLLTLVKSKVTPVTWVAWCTVV